MEIADRDGVVAIAGAKELLVRLPAGGFSLVTSATRALAVARLEHAGIPAPESFVTAEDVLEGKPSPEPYLKGAARLGVSAAECLVFEDTPAGIESAKAAGMRVIALCTTYPAKQLGAADAIVGSLAEVRAQVGEGHIVVTIQENERSNG